MSKFLTPPVWYDGEGNLVEILTGISNGGGVGIGKGANAEPGAVIIGNSGSPTSNSNGGDRVWIGYTAKYVPLSSSETVNMKSVVVGAVRVGASSSTSSDATTVSNSVLIGGIVSYQFPNLKINGSTIINSSIKNSYGKDSLTDVIAIGCQSGNLGATSDYIQIGSSDKTYSAQIGDGNGILKCRVLEIAPVSYRINKYFSAATSTISYPDNFILKQNGVYEFVFSINGGLQTVPIVFSGTKSDTVKTYFNLSYDDTSSSGMIIYGSVMWTENSISFKFSTLATPGGGHIKIYLMHIVYLGSF